VSQAISKWKNASNCSPEKELEVKMQVSEIILENRRAPLADIFFWAITVKTII